MIYLMRILLLTVVLSLAGQLTLQAQEEKTEAIREYEDSLPI